MRQYRGSFRVFLALVGGPRGILGPRCVIFISLGQMRRKYVKVGFRSKSRHCNKYSSPKTMLGKMRLSKMNVEYLLVSVGAPSALQCQIHMCLEWTKLVYNKEWVQMHIATTVSFF